MSTGWTASLETSLVSAGLAASVGSRASMQDHALMTIGPLVNGIPTTLAVVSDGHGELGAFCAQQAARMVPLDLNSLASNETAEQPDHCLIQALAKVDAQLCNLLDTRYGTASDKREELDSGCMLVVAWVGPGWALLGHVGDCRGYAITGEQLNQVTSDHPIEVALDPDTQLPPARMLGHPDLRKSGQTNGQADVVRLKNDAWSDGLVLVTDGVDAAKLVLANSKGTAVEAAFRALAMSAPLKDNAAAVVLRQKS